MGEAQRDGEAVDLGKTFAPESSRIPRLMLPMRFRPSKESWQQKTKIIDYIGEPDGIRTHDPLPEAPYSKR